MSLKKLVTGGVGLSLAATGLTLASPGAATAADPVTVNLLNINDFHGRIDQNTTKFATTVEQLRAEHGDANTLFLSAGDNIGASLFASSLQDDEPTIEVLNALELDTSAVGNHEFDQGFEDLDTRVAGLANFDYLGANVYDKGTTTPAMEEYDTFEIDGVTVGVIGAVTETTPTIVSPSGVANLDFGDPVAAVNRVAAQLSDGNAGNGEADVIVAEYHEGAGSGTPDGATLEQEVAAGGVFADIVNETSAQVDAIFTGHTHKVYAWDAPVPGQPGETRPVLQTGSYGANIGQIELSVDPDTGDVVSYTQQNVARVANEDLTFPRVQEVKDIVDAALAHAAEVGNQPVGTITADITTAFNGGEYVEGKYAGGNRDDRTRESTLGELVANALRDEIQDIKPADIGITNPGGLRNELLYAGNTAGNPQNTDGVVTYAEANAILTFSNTVAVVDMTGADLFDLLEQQWPTGARTGYLQLALSDNVNVVADPTAAAGSRILSVRIDGEEVDLDEVYSVSTFTFLATGGDSFTAFTKGKMLDTGLLDLDLFRAYLANSGPLSPDFARQQVFVEDFPETPVEAGQTVQFQAGVGATESPVLPINPKTLDLTSLGSPENTELEITGIRGQNEYDLGTVPVTDGIADVSLTVPVELIKGGVIELVAQPSGTTITIPVADSRAVPEVTVKTRPDRVVVKRTRVRVKVAATAADAPATGEVRVRAGGTGYLTELNDNGRAKVKLKPFRSTGKKKITVVYLGNETTHRAKTTTTVRVVKKK